MVMGIEYLNLSVSNGIHSFKMASLQKSPRLSCWGDHQCFRIIPRKRFKTKSWRKFFKYPWIGRIFQHYAIVFYKTSRILHFYTKHVQISWRKGERNSFFLNFFVLVYLRSVANFFCLATNQCTSYGIFSCISTVSMSMMRLRPWVVVHKSWVSLACGTSRKMIFESVPKDFWTALLHSSHMICTTYLRPTKPVLSGTKTSSIRPSPNSTCWDLS